MTFFSPDGATCVFITYVTRISIVNALADFVEGKEVTNPKDTRTRIFRTREANSHLRRAGDFHVGERCRGELDAALGGLPFTG